MPTHVYERARSLTYTVATRIRNLATSWARLALAGVISLLGVAALAGPAMAMPQSQGTHYQFETLDNQADPTFNQLLGINQNGLIAGYFGSGAQDHPNKGYLLSSPYGQQQYLSENFPGSVQTQVTGLNDRGVTVGFWSDQNNANLVNDNFGFVAINGRRFRSVNFPTGSPATPPVDQLLGVNDNDVAVGFYTDANGNNHGYTYNIDRNRYRSVTVPGATSTTAAAINNQGDIAGSETDANGNVDGFLRTDDGQVVTLDYPGASMTQALGVNDRDEVVGVYTNADNTMHGFTWTPWGGFTTVDDPNGIGATTINGVNDQGELVGFYTDAAGNTDGLLALPQEQHRHHHR